MRRAHDMKAGDYEIRRARPSDADRIAAAHRDSIASIGPTFYSQEVVAAWEARVAGDLYVRAMERGEVFFIALGVVDGAPAVLGFASHRVDGAVHGSAVYVRGAAARRGIGSALYRCAEAHAVAAAARSIEVDASLAAVEFYRANGFEEVGRGDHRLPSGARMACVYMRKAVTR